MNLLYEAPIIELLLKLIYSLKSMRTNFYIIELEALHCDTASTLCNVLISRTQLMSHLNDGNLLQVP